MKILNKEGIKNRGTSKQRRKTRVRILTKIHRIGVKKVKGVLTAPLTTQLSADTPGKATEDGQLSRLLALAGLRSGHCGLLGSELSLQLYLLSSPWK